MDLELHGEDMFDFNASNDDKLKMFLRGYEQTAR